MGTKIHITFDDGHLAPIALRITHSHVARPAKVASGGLVEEAARLVKVGMRTLRNENQLFITLVKRSCDGTRRT